MIDSAFPVIDSTLSPEHLALWVAEQYGLGNVSCTLLKTNMNHSYLVKANNEQYILRIYNQMHRDILQVSAEVDLLNELKHNVSVSYPVINAKGIFVQEINAPEGKRFAVLFSYAKGKKRRYINSESNYKIGETIGRLHQATQNKTIERAQYSAQTLVGWAYKEAAKYISEELEEMKMIKNSEAILSNKFSNPTLRTGVVHLDIWYDNMNIQEDGTVTLFDFDNIGNGCLILDIGYYCMQMYYIETDKTEYEKKKSAFIEGYRSITPVSDEELELVPYAGLAIWIYYLGVQAQRFDNFANIFLSENYVKMYIGRVKDWLKYHNIEIPLD